MSFIIGALAPIGDLFGLQTLIETFYRIMENTTEFRPLFDRHPNNIELTIDKLVSFLSGWMGGEKLFSKKYGPISLPQAYAHLVVTEKKSHAAELHNRRVRRTELPRRIKSLFASSTRISSAKHPSDECR
jgi:truncated hemoglobin YjbI